MPPLLDENQDVKAQQQLLQQVWNNDG
jgi:ATP-binding cassette subfamily A (ABC1) protein 3